MRLVLFLSAALAACDVQPSRRAYDECSHYGLGAPECISIGPGSCEWRCSNYRLTCGDAAVGMEPADLGVPEGDGGSASCVLTEVGDGGNRGEDASPADAGLHVDLGLPDGGLRLRPAAWSGPAAR